MTDISWPLLERPPTVCLSIHPSTYSFTSVHLSLHLSTRPSICPSIHLSIRVSVRLSLHLSIYHLFNQAPHPLHPPFPFTQPLHA